MQMFKYPTLMIPHVKLLSIEKLASGRKHVTRTTKETVLYYILDGSLNIESNRKELHLLPGDIYIFDKGEYQRPLTSQNCSYYYLHFFNSLESVEMDKKDVVDFYLTSQKKFMSISNSDYDVTNSKENYLLIPQRINILNSSYYKKINSCFQHGSFDHHAARPEFFNFRSNIKVAEIFLYLHLTLSEKPLYDEVKKSYNNVDIFNDITVRNIIQYLNTNIQKQITSQDLEKEFRYSFDYMNRCFKKATKNTIFSYLRQIRIDQAEIMLYTKDIPVSKIAEQVGFCNVYHFSSTFKALTGLTPSQFAKNNPPKDQ